MYRGGSTRRKSSSSWSSGMSKLTPSSHCKNGPWRAHFPFTTSTAMFRPTCRTSENPPHPLCNLWPRIRCPFPPFPRSTFFPNPQVRIFILTVPMWGRLLFPQLSRQVSTRLRCANKISGSGNRPSMRLPDTSKACPNGTRESHRSLAPGFQGPMILSNSTLGLVPRLFTQLSCTSQIEVPRGFLRRTPSVKQGEMNRASFAWRRDGKKIEGPEISLGECHGGFGVGCRLLTVQAGRVLDGLFAPPGRQGGTYSLIVLS